MVEYIEITETNGRNVLFLLDDYGSSIGSIDYANVYTSGNNVHFVNGETKFTASKDGFGKLETPLAVVHLEMSKQAYEQCWALILTMGMTVK